MKRGSGHANHRNGRAVTLAPQGRYVQHAHYRASAVAEVLSATGFPDSGKQLQQLAKEPSPC
ncbi:hypothetical protein EWJ82_20025 [Salmonella enterica subsp. enterica serovar Weybridge]|nr:hypothetical protein [Salmonella enterica subsp. enterica serovar Weybridge]